jgi:hypothetical protein
MSAYTHSKGQGTSADNHLYRIGMSAYTHSKDLGTSADNHLLIRCKPLCHPECCLSYGNMVEQGLIIHMQIEPAQLKYC